jgi:hypothetical protein
MTFNNSSLTCCQLRAIGDHHHVLKSSFVFSKFLHLPEICRIMSWNWKINCSDGKCLGLWLGVGMKFGGKSVRGFEWVSKMKRSIS